MGRKKLVPSEATVKSVMHSDRVACALLCVSMALRLGWRAGRHTMAGASAAKFPRWGQALLVEAVGLDGNRALIGWNVHDDHADRIAHVPEFGAAIDHRLRASSFDCVALAVLSAQVPMPSPSSQALDAAVKRVVAAEDPPATPSRLPPELGDHADDWSDWS